MGAWKNKDLVGEQEGHSRCYSSSLFDILLGETCMRVGSQGRGIYAPRGRYRSAGTVADGDL